MKLVSIEGEVPERSRLPACVKALLEAAQTIPDGEGWDTIKMSEHIGRGYQTVQTNMGYPILKKVKIKVSNKVYWANEKTVAKETKLKEA